MRCGRSAARMRREPGQAVIEFALTIGFLTILMVGMLEVMMLMYNYAVLTNAAKEGVRFAIVHGSSVPTFLGSGTIPTVSTTVRAFLASSVHNVSSANVDVQYPDGNNNPGNRVEVTVSYSYSPLFLSDWASITISANSVGRIQF
ncbi:MAG: pilus assembly protein [Acidobacteria bacterium]|nr:pilus assembly protein [Acidobacteriota bacterium]